MYYVYLNKLKSPIVRGCLFTSVVDFGSMVLEKDPDIKRESSRQIDEGSQALKKVQNIIKVKAHNQKKKREEKI